MNTRTIPQCKNIWEFRENYFMTESVRIIKWYWHDIKTTINSSKWKSFECHHSKCILKSTSLFPPWCSSLLKSKVKQLSLNEQLLLVKNFLIDNNFVKVTTSRDKVFSCRLIASLKIIRISTKQSYSGISPTTTSTSPDKILSDKMRWESRRDKIFLFLCFYLLRNSIIPRIEEILQYSKLSK